jgi:hypothetical protein
MGKAETDLKTALCCAGWTQDHPEDSQCPQHASQAAYNRVDARAWDKHRRVMRGDFVAYSVS